MPDTIVDRDSWHQIPTVIQVRSWLQIHWLRQIKVLTCESIEPFHHFDLDTGFHHSTPTRLVQRFNHNAMFSPSLVHQPAHVQSVKLA